MQNLTPEEILAAIYRHPDNEGDTTVYNMPRVLATTKPGWTRVHMTSVNGRVEEVLHIQYRPAEQDYLITFEED